MYVYSKLVGLACEKCGFTCRFIYLYRWKESAAELTFRSFFFFGYLYLYNKRQRISLSLTSTSGPCTSHDLQLKRERAECKRAAPLFTAPVAKKKKKCFSPFLHPFVIARGKRLNIEIDPRISLMVVAKNRSKIQQRIAQTREDRASPPRTVAASFIFYFLVLSFSLFFSLGVVFSLFVP